MGVHKLRMRRCAAVFFFECYFASALGRDAHELIAFACLIDKFRVIVVR